MEEVNLYVVANLKGPRRQAGAAMYLLECVTSKGTQTRKGIIQLEETTENQLTLTALDEAMKRLTRSVNLKIWIDCEHVAGAIMNGWPERWEKEGWTNAKGKPISDGEKWQSVLSKMRANEVSVNLKERHAYWSWMTRELKKAVEQTAAAGGLMPET